MSKEENKKEDELNNNKKKSDRNIIVNGVISMSSVGKWQKEILELLEEDSTSPIQLILSTYGGDVYASFLFYDFLRALKIPIIIQAVGPVMSAGTVILCAGTYRIATENTRFMIHELSTSIGGNMSNINNDVKECKHIMKQISKIYAKHSKLTAKEWAEKLKEGKDIYLSAQQAKKLGLINEVNSQLGFVR